MEIDNESKSYAINYIPPSNNISPLLITFPKGTPFGIDNNDQQNENDKVKFQYHTKIDKNNIKSYISADVGNIKYEANQIKVARKYAIGMIKTSSINLYPIENIHIARQIISGIDDINPVQLTNITSQEDESRSNTRAVVFDAFGARKKQKQLKAKQANIVQLGDDSNDGISRAITSALEETATVEAHDAIETINSSSLPPFDAETDEIPKIYLLEKILPLQSLDMLKYKPFLAQISKQTNIFSNIVVSLATSLGNVFSDLKEEQKRNRGNALVLLHYLLRFYKMKLVVSDTSIKEQLDPPLILVDFLLQSFSTLVEGKWKRTPELVIKLKLYIAVLCLLASNRFTLASRDVTSLSGELGIAESACYELFKQTGCVALKKNKDNPESDVIFLKAPLKFPSVRLGKRK